jgi:hypothetical protein
MPARCVIFILLFDDDNVLDGDLDNYNSDYKDAPDPEEVTELDLDLDIILLEDNNNLSDSESK